MGPFPWLIDLFGCLVSLVETRAALLSFHRYATFALAYLVGSGAFPGLMDLFGGLVSLVETQAA